MNHKLDCVEGGWPAPDSERNLNFEEAINASCKKSLTITILQRKCPEIRYERKGLVLTVYEDAAHILYARTPPSFGVVTTLDEIVMLLSAC